MFSSLHARKQALNRIFNVCHASCSLSAARVAALLLTLPVACWAFGETITSNKPSAIGTNRFVSMTGTFTLLPGESLKMVRVFTLNSKKQANSFAQGTFNQANQTWATSVGDFQLAYYYTEFTVTYGNSTRTYDTATFTWHP